jgi:hypothetical protein
MATKTVVVAGKAYNDGDWHAIDNPYGLGQGGHRQNNNFINLLLDLLSEASPGLQDTSTTSLVIGIGSKILTLISNRPIPEGVDCYIIDAVTPTNRMFGTVTDHTNNQLTVDVTVTTGSGTYTSWVVQPAGVMGAGIGGNAALTALSALTPAADKAPYFSGSSSAAVFDISSFARTFLGDANATEALTTLGAIGQGVHSIPVPAAAMTANTTNGAEYEESETTTNKVVLGGFKFDQSTDEAVQFAIPMPVSWDEGTITVQFYWTTSVASGDVIWTASAVAFGDNDALDAPFGTAQSVADASNGAGDLNVSSATSAITVAGSPQAGDMVYVKIVRDADNGSDTLAGDAKLVGVKINIGINAVTD